MKRFLTNHQNVGTKKIQLTCDELSSLLEVGENKVAHHIEACKEEDADLNETHKTPLKFLQQHGGGND